MRARLLILMIGLAAAAYGAWLLLGQGLADVVTTAIWLAAGVVVHDFVVVPLTLGLGWVGTWLLPERWRAAVSGGLLALGSLTLLAVPVLGGWGANSDNRTILDRNYGLGWLAVAALTILVVLVAGRFSRRARAGAARGPAPHDAAPRE